MLGFCALFFSLSVSVFVISLSQIFLGLIWLLERDYKTKLKRVSGNKYFWLITSVFFLHVAGVVYSSDLNYAMNDLRIKLPLILIPFFFASIPSLSKKEIKIILYFFIAGLMISTSFSYYDYLSNIDGQGFDIRTASRFISHVRLSLMLAFATICLLHEFGNKENGIMHKVLAFLLAFAFMLYMVKLQMLTGILSFGIALFILFELKYIRHPNKLFRNLAIAFPILTIISLSVYTYSIVSTFISPKPLNDIELVEKTASGNDYWSNKENLQLENGNYVWDFLCEFEVKPAWEKRSKVEYYKMGYTGESVRTSLIRYLTSKNIHKDKEGVMGLSREEINAIENGATNYLYINEKGLSKRIYETAWELHNYLVNNDNPSGNSVAQRLEFWRAALHVISNNWIVGVGTGDVVVELNKAYSELNSVLDKEFWHKPHNQYMTIFVSFGFIGLVWFLYVLISCMTPIRNNYLALTFFIIITLSMLTEDTLETQVGATLYVGFLSFFVLGDRKEKEVAY